MTELVNENKSLKGELRGIPEISRDTREDTTKIYERKKNLFHSDIGHHLETMKKRSKKLNNEG